MIFRNRVLFFGLLVFIGCGDDETQEKKFKISGTVISESGQGLSGISILNNNVVVATTEVGGAYNIEDLDPGAYAIRAQEATRSFTPSEIEVTITNEDSEGNDFLRVSQNQIIHNSQTWNLFNPGVYFVKQNTSTTLQLDLTQNALWFQASQGGLIYQNVTGNFTITATVNAVKKSDNTQSAACDICLGGLMARNPNTGSGENYVHVVSGVTPNGVGYETKNTTNNVSPYSATGDANTKHDLRIQRTGSTFTLYQRLSGAITWNVAATFDRPDLPATLMVGINIYTAQAGAVADLSVVYENVVIE
ncbi:MAG TPA: carboxypeptidase-like regulatory domain-containing protein [Cyclobacteriaceae bacterium]|nr:carboxypeptidase-like regulatory domain-containing protein [Cyclobacteriaceae bacterium]